MAVVTVLGAGAMGSALTTPAVAANQVRLWGTWLDGAILDELRAGRRHPRTDAMVDPRVRLYDADALEEAMAEAEVVVLAISSEGVLEVLGLAVRYLRAGTIVPFVTKGFGRDRRGLVRLLPAVLEEVIPPDLRERCPLVAIGGPCKANEVGAGRPSGAVYASRHPGVAGTVADLLATDAYRVELSDDVEGVEAAAALKNIYAIGIGVCEGLGERGQPGQPGEPADPGELGEPGERGQPFHDLEAAVFTQAVAEMRQLTAMLGGNEATVGGLAGTGDLHVTGRSGRNKLYGERIGRGEPAREALEAMAAGQAVEGAPAARLARDLVEQRADQLSRDALPLLHAINDLLDEAGDPAELLAEAALPPRRRARTG
jgi:glycerol-3-phosphate dehydrogenase (NAD(P)+)